MRIERRSGGLFDCDATGCYDRILPPLASVHLRTLGLAKRISTFLARMMHLARRYVKTKHGISKESIKTTKRQSLYGIGQGNGGGPAIWLAHLTVMFKAISSVCKGAEIAEIEGKKKITTVGTGYVDDVTLNITVEDNENQEEGIVRRKLKQIAQKWEALLYITGGKLELSKCFWAPITWKWAKGKPKLNTKARKAKALILKESETKEKIEIPRLATGKAEKRLGIHYAVEGHWITEFRKTLQYTKDFAEKVKYGNMDKISGYHAYHSLWLAKFRYSAAIVCYSSKQTKRIETAIVGPSLAAAGYSSKMPRAVVFGPEEYGGMAWDHPQSVTLIEKVKLIMGSIRRQDTVGKIFLIQLSWLQVISGRSTPILEITTPIEYLPNCWIKNFQTLLARDNIQIKIAEAWKPREQRENDEFIMEYVCKNLPSWTWEAINRCRLYLKAVTFTDIVTFDGKWVPKEIYQLERPQRQTRLKYPRQKKPSKSDKKYWQHFIQRITTEHGELLIPLGKWHKNPYQKFPYIKDLRSNEVLRAENNKWDVYEPKKAKKNRYTKTSRKKQELPEDWCPIHVIKTSTEIVSLPSQCTDDHQRAHKARPIIGHFRSKSEKQTVGQFTIAMDQIPLLKSTWAQGELTLYCGADGGLKEGIGTSGYNIFISSEAQPLVVGHAAEVQKEHTASSTRQELLAQIAIEYWIQHLAQCLGLTDSKLKVVIITDSAASISIVEGLTKEIGAKRFLQAEAEAGMELATLRSLQTNTKYETVKVISHIERVEAPNERFWELNDLADRLATAAREKTTVGEMVARQPCMLPHAKVACFINGKMTTNNRETAIRAAISEQKLIDYLCIKNGWNKEDFEQIGRAHV